VRGGDPAALKDALTAVGYLPGERAGAVDADAALTLMRMATSWYAKPGFRRFGEQGTTTRHEPPDREMREQAHQFALPPESLLIRRMHAIVAVVLGQLRAGADWGAIAAEYLSGAPAATPLGELDAAR
jgi:hypothetical protein